MTDDAPSVDQSLDGSPLVESQCMLPPSLVEAFWFWLRIGFLSFGGPAAQISLMHSELVKDRGWLSEQQYLHALSFCMLLPGPEAMQLATYAGWRLHGVKGGLLAGSLFVLPGSFIILLLAGFYSAFGSVPIVEAFFIGIKSAVIIIVIQALWRISKKTLVHFYYWLIAGASFVGIFFFAIPFPYIVVSALLLGFVFFSSLVPAPKTQDQLVRLSKVSFRFALYSTLKTALVWLSIWWLPLLLIIYAYPSSVFADMGIFFSKLAVVTFGGAYAVLSYMAQDVVVQYGWLSAQQMIDGLGLAETTPGPLILVTEFVGFLAASQHGFWFGVFGALIALWATFVPCFLWVFLGAPYIEWLGGQARIKSALNCVTAAVVGVILNLSLWFFLHVLFGEVTLQQIGWLKVWTPDVSQINWQVLILMFFGAYILFMRKLNIIWLLSIVSFLGLLLNFLPSL